MLAMGNIETVIFHTTFIPMGGMHLHARTSCILTHVFYTHGCNVFIHGRIFWTLAQTTSIPMGGMQERSVHYRIRSYTHCGHQFLPW